MDTFCFINLIINSSVDVGFAVKNELTPFFNLSMLPKKHVMNSVASCCVYKFQSGRNRWINAWATGQALNVSSFVANLALNIKSKHLEINFLGWLTQ